MLRAVVLAAAVLAPLPPARLSPAGQAPSDAPPAPRVFLLNLRQLETARQGIRRADAALLPAWTALQADAARGLTVRRFSVVDKDAVPPSGDKHDYTSQAPYFWRNPATPDGLPYVRRDGERNPEIDRITDHRALDGLASNVETLALAFYFGGDDRYAARAAELLRAWFVDPSITRLLNYSITRLPD